jgi:hypothetical protein
LRRFLGGVDGCDGKDESALNSKDEDDRTSSLDMAHTFRPLHPNTKGCSYYSRDKTFGDNSDRVDMILCFAVPRREMHRDRHVSHSSRTPGPSDHVPIPFCQLRCRLRKWVLLFI